MAYVVCYKLLNIIFKEGKYVMKINNINNMSEFQILDNELKQIDKEINQLDNDRKQYKKQSEYHRMMYVLILKRETTQQIIDKLCQ